MTDIFHRNFSARRHVNTSYRVGLRITMQDGTTRRVEYRVDQTPMTRTEAKREADKINADPARRELRNGEVSRNAYVAKY